MVLAARRAFATTLAAAIALLLVAGCPSRQDGSPPPGTTATPGTNATVPTPDHVVIVVFENRAEGQVIGPAPYLTGLASQGARFTRSYALTHPSQPNYIALFSGSTHRVTSNACPQTLDADNLGHQLRAAGRGFAGYSQGLPSPGYTGCLSGRYARKHNPWVNFTTVPASANLPLSQFPTDYATLPTVSFVVPDLCDGMHDCPVATGDNWARGALDGYAQWAKTHNSLLIVTFDEDDGSADNRIPTLFVGAMVRPGNYDGRIDHYTVLRTIEDMYGLPCLGHACGIGPITAVWRKLLR